MFGIPPTVDDPFLKLEQSAAVLRTFGLDEKVMLDAAREGKQIRADYDAVVVKLLDHQAANALDSNGMTIRKTSGCVLTVSCNYQIWQPGMGTATETRDTVDVLVSRFYRDLVTSINNNSVRFNVHRFEPATFYE
jgi:hypothetical protein